jgi:Trk K+ transport system NAD-binding subunit
MTRLMRYQRAWIPRGEEVIQAHDAVYILVESEFSNDLYALWNWTTEPISALIFLEYSPVLLAALPQVLSRGHSVSVVCEKDEHLLDLSQKFPSVQLIRGDIVDPNVLDHVIRGRVGVIATGENEKQNILATLMATNCGAQHTMAWVQQLGYLSPLCVRGIGKMIHAAPRMLTRILEKMTQPYLETIYPLQGIASGAVMEITVDQNAKIAGKSCLDWQEERWRIMAICRHKKWFWNPETIEIGDRAIATALPDGYRIFQQAFGTSFIQHN